MDEFPGIYPVTPRYPICPDCKASLCVPAEHDGVMTCSGCGLELRLPLPGMEERPMVYYVSTLSSQKRRKPPPRVTGPSDVHRLLRPFFGDAEREMFYSLVLSMKNHVLEINLVSIGSLSASVVHPREIFRPAIRRNGAAIIVAHNHPSGDPTPSPEDIQISCNLVKAGKLLRIPVLDHVIVAGDGFVSLKEDGHLGD